MTDLYQRSRAENLARFGGTTELAGDSFRVPSGSKLRHTTPFGFLTQIAEANYNDPNYLRDSFKSMMEMNARTASSISLGLGAIPAAIDYYSGGGTELQDKYFKTHKETFASYRSYWTPDPETTSMAAQVTGMFASIIPQIFANPAGAIGALQIGEAQDLIEMGTPPTEAQIVGGIEAISMGLGFKVPMLGRTAAQRMLIGGAGFNWAQGVATRAIQQPFVEGEAAAMYDPWSLELQALDVALGLAFGAFAQFSPEARAEGEAAWDQLKRIAEVIKPSDAEALAVLRQAYHARHESARGPVRTIDQANQHVDRLEATIKALTQEPDVVPRPLPPEPKIEPDKRRDEERDELHRATTDTARAVLTEEGVQPPIDPSRPLDVETVQYLFRDEQAGAIANVIEERLVEIGQTPEEAKANAAIWEAWLDTTSILHDVTPYELMTRTGLDIRTSRMGDGPTEGFTLMQGQRDLFEEIAKLQEEAVPKADDLRARGNLAPDDKSVLDLYDALIEAYGLDERTGVGRYGVFLHRGRETDAIVFSAREDATTADALAALQQTKELARELGVPVVIPNQGLGLQVRSVMAAEERLLELGFRGYVGRDDDAWSRQTGDANPIVLYWDPRGWDQQYLQRDKNSTTLFQSGPGSEQWYFSQLEREISGAQMQQAPGQGWKEYLRSRVGRGLKPDEIEWTGIADWLDMQEGRVTKEQVQAFLKDRGVQVTEIVLGETTRRQPNDLTGNGLSHLHLADWDFRSINDPQTGKRVWSVVVVDQAKTLDELSEWYQALPPEHKSVKFHLVREAARMLEYLNNGRLIQTPWSVDMPIRDKIDMLEQAGYPLDSIADAEDDPTATDNIYGYQIADEIYTDSAQRDEIQEAAREEGHAENYARDLANNMANVLQAINRVEENVSGSTPENKTRFGTWVMPGGTNYREILLRMPPGSINTLPPGWRVEVVDGDRWIGVSPAGNRVDINPYTRNKEEAAAALLRELRNYRHPQVRGSRSFTRGHYGQENVLAHIRLNERVQPDGTKTLFVEELQSDWATTGKKNSFLRPAGKLPPLEQMMSDMGLVQSQDAGTQLYSLHTEDGDLLKTVHEPWQIEIAVQDMWLRSEGSGRAEPPMDAVPAAPFVARRRFAVMLNEGKGPFLLKDKAPPDSRKPDDIRTFGTMEDAQRAAEGIEGARAEDIGYGPDTEAWTRLTMKRVIRYAAENGYDTVAWTTGEQQVERYTNALRQAVDGILWEKTDEGIHIRGYKGTLPPDPNAVPSVEPPPPTSAWAAAVEDLLIEIDPETSPQQLGDTLTFLRRQETWPSPEIVGKQWYEALSAESKLLLENYWYEQNRPWDVERVHTRLARARTRAKELYDRLKELRESAASGLSEAELVGKLNPVGPLRIDDIQEGTPEAAALRDATGGESLAQTVSEVEDVYGEGTYVYIFHPNGLEHPVYMLELSSGARVLEIRGNDVRIEPGTSLEEAYRQAYRWLVVENTSVLDTDAMMDIPTGAEYIETYIELQATGAEQARLASMEIDLERQNPRPILAGNAQAAARTAEARPVVDTTKDESALSDAIGKAMAQQIIDDPRQSGLITGDNIRIDDTGMAGYYDRMLPRITNDLLKKMGTKVEVMDVEMFPTTAQPTVESEPPATMWVPEARLEALDDPESSPTARFMNDQELQEFAGAEHFDDGTRPLIMHGAMYINGVRHDMTMVGDALGFELHIYGDEGDLVYRTDWEDPEMDSAFAQSVMNGMAINPEAYVENWQALQNIGGQDFQLPASMSDVRPTEGNKQLGFKMTDKLRDYALAGQPLFQDTRGRVTFGDNQTLIEFLENADRSTMGHESSHVFLQMTRDLAMRIDAPEQAVAQWRRIAKALDLPSDEPGKIPREKHELFAEGWETFMAEGTAPTPELRSAFQQFRDWLIRIYEAVTRMRVQLNDDMRAMYNEMLDARAAESSAAAARSEQANPPPAEARETPSSAEAKRLTIDSPELKEHLTNIEDEFGWAQEGGKYVGSKSMGEANFTEWVPKSEWWPRKGKGMSEAKAREAVRRWRAGEKLRKPEAQFMDLLVDVVNERIAETAAATAPTEAPTWDPITAEELALADIEPTAENVADAELVARAADMDEEAMERAAIQYEDDYDAFIEEARRIAGEQPQAEPARAQDDRSRPAREEPESGAEEPVDALDAAARAFVDTKPDQQIVTGYDQDGTPIAQRADDYLAEADQVVEMAKQDRDLFKIAAACLFAGGNR